MRHPAGTRPVRGRGAGRARLGAILVAAVMPAWSQQPPPPRTDPAATAAAQRLFQASRWKTTHRCDKAVQLDIEIDKAEVAAGQVRLQGKARGASAGADPKKPNIDSIVTGSYDPATGLVALDASLAPDDPDYCPTVKVFGRCMKVSGPLVNTDKLMEKHRQERAALAATSSFRMELANEGAAPALTGTVRGRAFDCADIALARADQQPPSALMPSSLATERAAAGRVDATRIDAPLVQQAARLRWMQAAARRGDPIAQAETGMMFERGAGLQAPDPVQAVAFYRQAAQAGEVRAQRRLSELLASGAGGVPQDRAESERWAQAAKATTAEVGRVCVAPAMIDGYRRLFESVKRDPANLMLQMFGTMLTGMSFDEGSFRIEGVGVEAVTLPDGPFMCRVVGRRVGAQVRNLTPAFSYAGEDDSGRALYFDNRGDVAVNEAVASLTTALAANVQATQPFSVQPLGGSRYRVVLVQQLIQTGTTHATEVVVTPDALPPLQAPSPPPDPAPVPAPAAPPAPPAPRPDQRASPPPADAAAPRDEAVQASVDAGLAEWSREWRNEQYQRGSLQVAQSTCARDSCQVSGTFALRRGTSVQKVPFTGVLVRKPQGGLGVKRLCTANAATGATDCIDF